MNAEHATIDFETRSACDIRKAGAYRYAIDPTTSILCLAFTLPGDVEPRLWHPDFPLARLPEVGRDDLEQLFFYISMGGLVEAHNVGFERAGWTHVGQARLGWPELRLEQLRCSAAKAAAFGLPRGLDEALAAMKLPVKKDAAGHRLMMKLSKPRRARKAEYERVGAKNAAEYLREHGLLWHESDAAELQRLFDYCRQDVRAERALSSALPDLKGDELEFWQLDQKMNWRGVRIDQPGVRRAIEICAAESKRFDDEMNTLTWGAVANCRKRAELLEAAQAAGAPIGDLKAATIDMALKGEFGPMSDYARQLLVLRRESARASVKKLHAMEARVCPDGRVRDLFVWCGAGHTGRIAGSGIQVQNFPRGNVKSQEAAWDELTASPIEWLRAMHGDVLGRIAGMLRGAIIASEGCRFVASDFSAIESVVLFWLANCDRALSILRSGGSLYKDMAGTVYGIQDPQKNVKKGTNEYQLGKQVILACGYGMGGPKFCVTCATYAIVMDEEKATDVVKLYRATYPEVPQLWYSMENAAVTAVRSPGTVTSCAGDRVRFCVVEVAGLRVLRMKLPSGRCLSYFEPKLEKTTTPWGAEREQLSYRTVHQKTKKWTYERTYSGKLCLERGTPVLTDRGLVPIEDVKLGDYVWDGVEWVNHGGSVCNGARSVVEFAGVGMTPDHEVWDGAWVAAAIGDDDRAAAACEAARREAVRHADGRPLSRFELLAGISVDLPLPVRRRKDGGAARPDERFDHELWLRQDPQTELPAAGEPNARDGESSRVLRVALDARSLSSSDSSGVAQLRSARDLSVRPLVNLRHVLGGHGAYVPAGTDTRADRQRERLQPGQLSMGDARGAGEQYPTHDVDRHAGGANADCASIAPIRNRTLDLALSARERMAERPIAREAEVFDILNAGPRRRFAVCLPDGRLVLVHNCENAVQAIARDLLRDAMLRADSRGYTLAMSAHDEATCDQPYGVGSLHELDEIMCEREPWAAGCPVSSDGFESVRYKK